MPGGGGNDNETVLQHQPDINPPSRFSLLAPLFLFPLSLLLDPETRRSLRLNPFEFVDPPGMKVIGKLPKIHIEQSFITSTTTSKTLCNSPHIYTMLAMFAVAFTALPFTMMFVALGGIQNSIQNSCNTSSFQCCQPIHNKGSDIGNVPDLIGINLRDVFGQIGIQCIAGNSIGAVSGTNW